MEIERIEKNSDNARTALTGYEGYRWKYMTAEKNSLTNDWLMENQNNGDAFWVKTKREAMKILKYVKEKNEEEILSI